MGARPPEARGRRLAQVPGVSRCFRQKVDTWRVSTFWSAQNYRCVLKRRGTPESTRIKSIVVLEGVGVSGAAVGHDETVD